MDEENYIDIEAELRDSFVYRIISVERLLQLFSRRENVLVSPRKWEDPFENFILNSPVQLSTGDRAIHEARRQIYGQCWTRHRASDAMWRIYSPQKNAVRIRSKISTILRGLAASSDCPVLEAFVGKVKYLSTEQLVGFAATALLTESRIFSLKFVRTLLVKRPAFAHEREIRLLYFCTDSDRGLHDLYEYSVDPHEMIDQIMIDPRLTSEEARAVRRTIQQQTAFRGPILRSLLYAPPPEMLVRF